MEKSKELDSLKKEILSEVKSSDSKKRGLKWGSITITLILVILTGFSVAQAFKSATVLTQIKDGGMKAAAPSSTSNSAPLPSSLNNLPDMVGGC